MHATSGLQLLRAIMTMATATAPDAKFKYVVDNLTVNQRGQLYGQFLKGSTTAMAYADLEYLGNACAPDCKYNALGNALIIAAAEDIVKLQWLLRLGADANYAACSWDHERALLDAWHELWV